MKWGSFYGLSILHKGFKNFSLKSYALETSGRIENTTGRRKKNYELEVRKNCVFSCGFSAKACINCLRQASKEQSNNISDL